MAGPLRGGDFFLTHTVCWYVRTVTTAAIIISTTITTLVVLFSFLESHQTRGALDPIF